MRLTAKLRTARARGLLARLRGQDQGVAAVELALIAPVLALIIIAIVDFGMAFTRQMTLANGVRAGVQYAMVRRPVQGDLVAIQDTVKKNAGVDLSDVSVTWVCECSDSGATAPTCSVDDCGGADVNHSLLIGVTDTYPLILSYPGINNPVTLGDTVLLRLN
ncbi:MAG: pilus assembly protein [Rhodospirillales bacterium]|nr:pilus assembly protein [Rhodospirillales bacterium]MDH3791536.1 pilus assembly protein [Rhodospirillales bacterium]MDH3966376.1 pilus assembly protein [Rhodospirillales bacterium]